MRSNFTKIIKNKCNKRTTFTLFVIIYVNFYTHMHKKFLEKMLLIEICYPNSFALLSVDNFGYTYKQMFMVG